MPVIKAYLVVQVRRCGSAGIPGLTYLLTSLHPPAFFDTDVTEVAIKGVKAVAVVDLHLQSQITVPPGGDHLPSGRGMDGCAGPHVNILPPVEGISMRIGVPAQSEPAGDSAP